MPQREIELILTRQLFGSLAIPAIIFDDRGNIVFFNEAAEEIVGLRFQETGPIDTRRLAKLIDVADENGQPFPDDRRPVQEVIRSRRPTHARLSIVRHSVGGERRVDATILPLIGQAGRLVGAIATFWEAENGA